MKTKTIDSMSKYVCNLLSSININIQEVREINFGKHLILIRDNGERYYFLFKRDGFHKWREYYPKLLEIENEIIYVDSMNKEYIGYCLTNNISKIICCLGKDNSFFWIDPLEWVTRSKKYDLKRQIRKIDYRRNINTLYDEPNYETVISCYFTIEDKFSLPETTIN